MARCIDLGLALPARLGPLTLYPAMRAVERDDGAREVVEPRVMQVLLLLTERQGEIVRRAELIERCWDGLAVGEDAINRAISRLRRLSEGIGKEAFRIETVPRTGYRLINLAATSADQPTDARTAGRQWILSLRFAALGMAAAGLVAIATIGLTHAGRSRSRNVQLPSPHGSTAPRVPFPADPAAAALLLQARDDWAERTSESLNRSIEEFERVTRLAPRFAPGFSGLADAYLLAGEAGSLPDNVAFDGAENAAERALKLDATLGDAHRAIGFVLYWQKHDAAGAGRAFREALRLDPDAAQSHFWYANVLADDGQYAPAIREFSRARLIDPGSDQIAADQAWALWMFGRAEEARARLTDIASRFPRNAEALDCLATIDLAAADYGGFLQASHALAKLRREPSFETRIDQLQKAFDTGGGPALLRAAFALEMRQQQANPYPDHTSAAFYASLAGDRASLVEALAAADGAGEHWGAQGYVSRIAAAWQSDGPIIAALRRRSSPAVETR